MERRGIGRGAERGRERGRSSTPDPLVAKRLVRWRVTTQCSTYAMFWASVSWRVRRRSSTSR